jgi:hypothetical protein
LRRAKTGSNGFALAAAELFMTTGPARRNPDVEDHRPPAAQAFVFEPPARLSRPISAEAAGPVPVDNVRSLF